MLGVCALQRGRPDFERFAGLVMLMAADIEQYEDDCVLLDLRQVQGRLSTEEQQIAGEPTQE